VSRRDTRSGVVTREGTVVKARARAPAAARRGAARPVARWLRAPVLPHVPACAPPAIIACRLPRDAREVRGEGPDYPVGPAWWWRTVRKTLLAPWPPCASKSWPAGRSSSPRPSSARTHAHGRAGRWARRFFYAGGPVERVLCRSCLSWARASFQLRFFSLAQLLCLSVSAVHAATALVALAQMDEKIIEALEYTRPKSEACVAGFRACAVPVNLVLDGFCKVSSYVRAAG
jgi:hypothetical protein